MGLHDGQLQRGAYEPKQLVLLPSGHFDAYVDAFDQASAAARDWFVRHLRAGAPRASRFERRAATAEVSHAEA